jgi:hypothetical protein
MSEEKRVVDVSFKMKLNETDKERTEIAFKLDFSKRSYEELLPYAEKEVLRIINNELRDGKRTLGDVMGKTIEVPILVVGTRGAKTVTPDKAKEVLALSLGVSVENLNKLLQTLKGATK